MTDDGLPDAERKLWVAVIAAAWTDFLLTNNGRWLNSCRSFPMPIAKPWGTIWQATRNQKMRAFAAR